MVITSRGTLVNQWNSSGISVRTVVMTSGRIFLISNGVAVVVIASRRTVVVASGRTSSGTRARTVVVVSG